MKSILSSEATIRVGGTQKCRAPPLYREKNHNVTVVKMEKFEIREREVEREKKSESENCKIEISVSFLGG